MTKTGIIYGIYHGKKLIYVGSTTWSLSKRRAGHKLDCKRRKEGDKLLAIADKVGWDNLKLKQLKKTKVANLRELKEIEQKYILKYKPKGNSFNAV